MTCKFAIYYIDNMTKKIELIIISNTFINKYII